MQDLAAVDMQIYAAARVFDVEATSPPTPAQPAGTIRDTFQAVLIGSRINF